MTNKSVFQGDVKGEDQIFWNPAGSPMAQQHTEGEENLNLSFFRKGDTNDYITRGDIGDDLFDAIKAVICVGGTWRENGSWGREDEPEAHDFMELYITKKELRGIERAVRGKK